jgi:hypothetical protein
MSTGKKRRWQALKMGTGGSQGDGQGQVGTFLNSTNNHGQLFRHQQQREEIMPRQARLDAPGTLHHVIIRGIEKRRIVDDREDCDLLVKRMGELALETGTVIYA